LGGRLIRQTLDAARAFGLHRVELTVRQDNRSPISLYRKIGFEIEGLMRDAMKVDGVCENTYLMSLLFK
jgi:RimJ/RimL family protein N-acetyltransferase